MAGRDLERQAILGNLFEQSLDEVWNGELYQALRKSLANARPEDHEACRSCDRPHDSSKFSASNIMKSATQIGHIESCTLHIYLGARTNFRTRATP